MSHSQNPLLKTLNKHRLESSYGEGEPLSHTGDAETYLPVDGAHLGEKDEEVEGIQGATWAEGCMGF